MLQFDALRNGIDRVRAVYEDYPRQFWMLMAATFIDMVGNALIFPFFALYVTDRFDVGMTQVGWLFILFSAAGIVGGTIGGALADRFGRKPMVLVALVFSAAGNMGIALAPQFELLFVIAPFVGVMGSIGGPARQAMLADLLPEEKRAEGFAIWRIEFNLAVVLGPMLGGLLAGYSYVLLFGVDAMTSLITAALLLVFLNETRPEAAPDAQPETVAQTFKGYGRVFRDGVFMAFLLISVALYLVYFQMNSTLSVYLRDWHDIPPQGFGLMITVNAAMVVLLQVSVMRFVRQRGYAQFLVMAAGAVLYAIGFGMYGVVAGYALFMLAMVIITTGEMLVEPVRQALATRLAPDDMRGRYMAVNDYGFAFAGGGGPWMAGLVMDHIGGAWVWYFAAVLGLFAAAGYVWLHGRLTGTERLAEPAADAIRQTGETSAVAVEAGR